MEAKKKLAVVLDGGIPSLVALYELARSYEVYGVAFTRQALLMAVRFPCLELLFEDEVAQATLRGCVHKIALAAAIAERGDMDGVAYSIPEEETQTLDAHGAMQAVLHRGFRKPLALINPHRADTLGDIIRRGYQLEAPIHQTMSCDVRSDFHCGRCGGCMVAKRAFKSAGVEPSFIWLDEIPTGAVVDRSPVTPELVTEET